MPPYPRLSEDHACDLVRTGRRRVPQRLGGFGDSGGQPSLAASVGRGGALFLVLARGLPVFIAWGTVLVECERECAFDGRRSPLLQKLEGRPTVETVHLTVETVQRSKDFMGQRTQVERCEDLPRVRGESAPPKVGGGSRVLPPPPRPDAYPDAMGHRGALVKCLYPSKI